MWDLSPQPLYIYSVVWFCFFFFFLLVSCVTVFKCDKAFTFLLRAFSLFTQSRLVSTCKLLSVDSVTHIDIYSRHVAEAI